MIKLKMEKVISRGDQELKIIEIEMLRKDQLPMIYTEVGESIYTEVSRQNYVTFNSTKKGLHETDYYWLAEGCSYPREVFQEKFETILRCGKRLQEINRLLTIENAGWEGIETIII